MFDIQRVISKGEGKTIEFKAQLPKGNNLAKSVVAFANVAGGKIIIGLGDKGGGLIGIKEHDAIDLPDVISNIIYDSCAPAIIPEIYTIHVLNKTLLVIEIYPGNFLQNKMCQV